MLCAAEEWGIRLLHENEKGIYGDIASRCLDLIEHFDGRLGCIFDPANFIQCGEQPLDNFALLKDKIEYMHIKDALLTDGSVVPSGKGDGNVPAILDGMPGEGDMILSIGGKRVHTALEMDYEIMRRGVSPVEVVVLRDTDGDQARDREVVLTVTFPTEVSKGQLIGARDFRVYAGEKTFGGVIKETFFRGACLVRMVWESIFDLITGRYTIEAVSGPIGIAGTMSEAVSYGFLPVLYLMAMISINLGVMNLVPLPALDGGRMLFILIEMIFPKPVPRETEAKIHTAGLFILLLLSIFVATVDVKAFF
jgi:RIP metalloprotease RseP